MNYHDLTIAQASQLLAKGELSSVELTKAMLERVAATEERVHAYITLTPELALEQAANADKMRAQGQAGPLTGVPAGVKDVLCTRGVATTCASRMLQNFTPPYSATLVRKLEAAGMVMLGKHNMDEFAMGSSTENSAFQQTLNPWNAKCVPGGSSGGSAAAVGAGIVPLALGSDTGGSIRQPAAFCGVVGLKPTYGRVSRYGLVAYASSLDQIGPFARSVEDAALLLHTISGRDAQDSTSDPQAEKHPLVYEYPDIGDAEYKKLRVGLLLPEDGAAGYDPTVIARCRAAAQYFEERGAKIVPVKSKLEQSLIPIYYILATAEASSNLSRYDGVRYGNRVENPADLMDLYVRTRTRGFGPEVKRRILLGTFVLSSGYYDAYYKSAQKARRIIQQEYAGFFQKVDVILSPTSPVTAFEIGDRVDDPIAMYQSDILTIAANLTGTPAVNVPAGLDDRGLPVGLQLLGAPFLENQLLRIARVLEGIPGFALDYGKRGGASAGKSQPAPVKKKSVPVKKAKAEPKAKAAPVAKKPAAKKKAAAAKKKSASKKKPAAKRQKVAAKKKAKAAPAKKKAVKKSSKKTAKKKAAKKKKR